MNKQLIDLSKFNEGVTLDVFFDFTGRVSPFLIFVTDPQGKVFYYYRVINSDQVQINLPVHPGSVLLFTDPAHKVKTIATGKIRINKIKYTPNYAIMTPRSYSFDDIREIHSPMIMEPVKGYNGMSLIPTDQPARFFPYDGVIEYGDEAISKYPQPTQEFVKEHEKAHYFYGRDIPAPMTWKKYSPLEQEIFQHAYAEDEWEADRYALYNMINKGYNFSNMFSSLTDQLSNNYISQERIKHLFDTIQKEHKNFNNDWV